MGGYRSREYHVFDEVHYIRQLAEGTSRKHEGTHRLNAFSRRVRRQALSQWPSQKNVTTVATPIKTVFTIELVGSTARGGMVEC